MKGGVLLAFGLCMLATARANWFTDVVSGIQEGIKDSFEEVHRQMEKAHEETAEHKKGVSEFLTNLDRHVVNWQKKFAETHGLNNTKGIHKKVKKLWKTLKKHVLKHLNVTDVENAKKKLKKYYKKLHKKHQKEQQERKEEHDKEHEKEEKKKGHKLGVLRIPLKKDGLIGVGRLIKAQKVFNKLSNMWSERLHGERKDFHVPEEAMPKESEEEDPTPPTEEEGGEEVKVVKGKQEIPILSNPQEIAKKVFEYARLIKMPNADIPKKEILKKTAQFFQMHKPKDLETGPHMTKEVEEEVTKEIKSKILHSKETEKEPQIDVEAKAEAIVKEQEKKFEELEKKWEERLQEKGNMKETKLPSIKDIPSKTILPAFIKMETIPGHRDVPEDIQMTKDVFHKKPLIGGKEDVDLKEEDPESEKHEVLLLPDMGDADKKPQDAKTSEDKKVDEELWVKFPDSEEKQKKTEEFQKIEGDIPEEFGKDKTEAKREEPLESVLEMPKEDVKIVEETEPTLKPHEKQELDDEGFRRRLMEEEEEWMRFKKTLMNKFKRLNQRIAERPWKQFKAVDKELNQDSRAMPLHIVEGSEEKVHEKKTYEEP